MSGTASSRCRLGLANPKPNPHPNPKPSPNPNPNQFGFRNATVHTCSNRCMLLHANFGSLKCVAAYMQLHGGSCDAWDRLLAGTATLATATKGLSPTATTAAATAQGKPKKHAAQCPGKASHSRFAKAGRRYFSDCCTRDTGDARAPKN